MNKLKTIIMVCLCVLSCMNVCAEDAGLFREDVRRNYITTYFGSRVISRMKFEGTQEYGGIMYHRFVSDYAVEEPPQLGFGKKYYHETSFRNKKGLPVLVREDSGKVFARFPNGYWPDGAEEEDPAKDYLDEIMLYDFNCNAGESFKSVDALGNIIEATVTKTDYVDVGGKKLKRQYVSIDDERSEDRYQTVEDIGIVKGGFFCWFQTTEAAGAPAVGKRIISGGEAYKTCLNTLTDANDDILYAPDDFCFGKEYLLGNEPDNVWEYATVENLPSNNDEKQCTRYTLSYYWFDGLEKKKDRIYKRMYLKKERVWTVITKADGTKECSSVEEADRDECVGLFRELGDGLYILPERESVAFIKPPYSNFESRPLEEDEEVCIYPVNVRIGTELNLWFDGYIASVQVAGITSCVTDVQKLYEYKITGIGSDSGTTGESIEFNKEYCMSVGNTGMGTFWNPKPNDNPGQYGEHEPRTFFNNKYSLDWDNTWVFALKGANLSPESTAEVRGVAIGESDRENSEVIYDIYGKRVVCPQPGSVYIRNGRKFICRH